MREQAPEGGGGGGGTATSTDNFSVPQGPVLINIEGKLGHTFSHLYIISKDPSYIA